MNNSNPSNESGQVNSSIEKPMNIYQVFVIDAMVTIRIDFWMGFTEREDIYECIAAQTRGKAKSIFWDNKTWDETYEFTDIRCQVIMKDVNRLPGLIEWDDPLIYQEPPEDATRASDEGVG